MPVIRETQVTVEEPLDSVAKLSPAEQVRFERGLKALRQQKASLEEKVVRCAKSYRLPPKQRERLRELLDKNKEGLITTEEEEELDALLEELDQRNLLLAAEIEKFAHQEVQEVIADARSHPKHRGRSGQDSGASMDKQGELS